MCYISKFCVQVSASIRLWNKIPQEEKFAANFRKEIWEHVEKREDLGQFAGRKKPPKNIVERQVSSQSVGRKLLVQFAVRKFLRTNWGKKSVRTICSKTVLGQCVKRKFGNTLRKAILWTICGKKCVRPFFGLNSVGGHFVGKKKWKNVWKEKLRANCGRKCLRTTCPKEFWEQLMRRKMETNLYLVHKLLVGSHESLPLSPPLPLLL